jgi:hypothetical protein
LAFAAALKFLTALLVFTFAYRVIKSRERVTLRNLSLDHFNVRESTLILQCSANFSGSVDRILDVIWSVRRGEK